MYAALHDDFDLEYGSVAEVVDAAQATLAGELTASERRGARDFVLHRLAVTM